MTRFSGSRSVTFEQLFLDLDLYNGKDIVIEGYYYLGWQTNVLSDESVYSGYALGYLSYEFKF